MTEVSFTRTIKVLGFKVAEVEVYTKYDNSLRSKEGYRFPGNKAVPVNPDLITPILAEVVKEIGGLVPESFQFGDGSTLIVDGNMDAYSAVQGLKRMTGKMGATRIVFGTAALTNAYNGSNSGIAGVFLRTITEIIKSNWEPQEEFLNEKTGI